ncbi:MAG: PHB depolymerase family esterase [Candidatus Omnitrophota bacterium]
MDENNIKRSYASKTSHIKKIFICFLLLVFVVNFTSKGFAQNTALSHSAIKCEDGKHSYIVYLPPDYDPLKKWPVLFCFDSEGAGELIAMLFSSAAINQHWIVVGSLDVKNDSSVNDNMDAQDALLHDVWHRYSIDPERLYTAGFSGGARMAYTMAYRAPDNFRGVIPCADGFGFGEVSKKVAVFHCVGKGDFRYKEVMDAHKYLTGRGVKSNLKVFEGVHQYPPKEVILEALDWMSKA